MRGRTCLHNCPNRVRFFSTMWHTLCPAMEPAAAALAGCGFRLTPFTAQTNRVKGKPVAGGDGQSLRHVAPRLCRNPRRDRRRAAGAHSSPTG